MMHGFKVWDKAKNEWSKKNFVIDQAGNLCLLFGNLEWSKEATKSRYQPVYSTGKTDKKGVEVWIGDRLRNKNGHEFTVKHCIEGIETCEKIGNKFENPELAGDHDRRLQ